MEAARRLIGAGNLVPKLLTLPFPHDLNVYQTCLNRTLFFLFCIAFGEVKTCSAIGAHSFAKLHGMFNLLDRPLIRIDERPTNTLHAKIYGYVFKGEK